MLQVSTIEKEFDRCVTGLNKRGISDADQVLKEILDQDSKRKRIQGELDEILHTANKLAKEIGQLFKEGKRDEAESAKQQSTDLKAKSKQLNEELQEVEESLTNTLYNIPNVPHESVPPGKEESDRDYLYYTGFKSFTELLKMVKINGDKYFLCTGDF